MAHDGHPHHHHHPGHHHGPHGVGHNGHGAAQWQNRSIFVDGGVDHLQVPKEPFAATNDPAMDKLFQLMDLHR